MKTTAYNFENWQEKLDELQDKVKKELAEIRKSKQEVQQMKENLTYMLDELPSLTRGKYIRDDERIIISAPEIIIGNVDKDGVLWNTSSSVVIRANDVNLEGSSVGEGAGGRITSRASSIRNIAEDPGKDGQEHVVYACSEIVSQARAIMLNSEAADGVFTTSVTPTTGIQLKSETGINISSTLSNKYKKDNLKNCAENLKKQIKDLEEKVKESKKQVQTL